MVGADTIPTGVWGTLYKIYSHWVFISIFWGAPLRLDCVVNLAAFRHGQLMSGVSAYGTKLSV
jgi:hypothetical protein